MTEAEWRGMKGARLHKSRFITPALVRGVIVKAPVRRPRTNQEKRESQPAHRQPSLAYKRLSKLCSHQLNASLSRASHLASPILPCKQHSLLSRCAVVPAVSAAAILRMPSQPVRLSHSSVSDQIAAQRADLSMRSTRASNKRCFPRNTPHGTPSRTPHPAHQFVRNHTLRGAAL
eukprot:COSAG01_NODE_228_length_21104_cov_210.303832_14_plen_175_part_00